MKELIERTERGWTEENDFRRWCARCKEWAIVCCGDEANGWFCQDCCDHPYSDREPSEYEEID